MVCQCYACTVHCTYKDAIQLNVNRGKSDSIEMKSFTDFLLKFLHNKCLKGTHTHTPYTSYTHTQIHLYTKYDPFFRQRFCLFYVCMWIESERETEVNLQKVERWRKHRHEKKNSWTLIIIRWGREIVSLLMGMRKENDEDGTLNVLIKWKENTLVKITINTTKYAVACLWGERAKEKYT